MLAKQSDARPIVLISGHVDVQMAVRAMKAGAVDVLTKPVREQDLLGAVNRAIAKDRLHRSEGHARQSLLSLYATLSEREKQVMALVAAGKLNEQIAADVELTEATVKLHRGQVMRKMGGGIRGAACQAGGHVAECRQWGVAARSRDPPPRAGLLVPPPASERRSVARRL